MNKPKSLENLIEAFSKLPSIGRKSAERLAYTVLDMEDDDVASFTKAISNAKKHITHCPICGALSEGSVCPICSNENRDNTTLMIVSNAKDVISIEKSEGYNGLYHVLNGEIALSKGKSVDSLTIESLLERVKNSSFKEIIIATNPTINGDTTALYIAKILEPYNLNITRLAYGLQMGGTLDYTDEITLYRALEGRHKI